MSNASIYIYKAIRYYSQTIVMYHFYQINTYQLTTNILTMDLTFLFFFLITGFPTQAVEVLWYFLFSVTLNEVEHKVKQILIKVECSSALHHGFSSLHKGKDSPFPSQKLYSLWIFLPRIIARIISDLKSDKWFFTKIKICNLDICHTECTFWILQLLTSDS